MTPSQERWAVRDSWGPKGSQTAPGDARSTPHASGEVRKSSGLVRSTRHCVLWPCSLHPSASLRGGRQIPTAKPRWPVSGVLRHHCLSPALGLGTAQWGSSKGSVMLGQKGLLSSKRLNKTTAHHCKSGNSRCGVAAGAEDPPPGLNMLLPCCKKSCITPVEKLLRVFCFRARRGAKSPNYHLQHLTCQALGHRVLSAVPRAPDLASKVFISEKLKPKLHLHNKKTPMLGASSTCKAASLAKQRR